MTPNLWRSLTDAASASSSSASFSSANQTQDCRLKSGWQTDNKMIQEDSDQRLKIKLPAGETFFPYATQYFEGSWVKLTATA